MVTPMGPTDEGFVAISAKKQTAPAANAMVDVLAT